MAQPERIYTLRELTRLLRLTPKRLGQLHRLGILQDGAPGYRFRDLVAARVAAGLLERGATGRAVREALLGVPRLPPPAPPPPPPPPPLLPPPPLPVPPHPPPPP